MLDVESRGVRMQGMRKNTSTCSDISRADATRRRYSMHGSVLVDRLLRSFMLRPEASLPRRLTADLPLRVTRGREKFVRKRKKKNGARMRMETEDQREERKINGK